MATDLTDAGMNVLLCDPPLSELRTRGGEEWEFAPLAQSPLRDMEMVRRVANPGNNSGYISYCNESTQKLVCAKSTFTHNRVQRNDKILFILLIFNC